LSDASTTPLEIPGYRLLEQIGEGGSGTVFRAEGKDGLARAFAIKIFPPTQRAAYERELATLRAIEAVRAAAGSQDLVETVAADRAGEHGYVVMEYVKGGSLEARVRTSGPLPCAEAIRLIVPVLRGLTLLHDAGILHKDVKPANVLVGDDGQARLGDFGLARPIDGPLSSSGTPGFCAPELYTGRPIEEGSARVDVYSVAATLYYLLTGEAPLPGRPDLFLLERNRIDRHLQGVLFEALADEPARRTATVADLGARLEETGDSVASEPPASRSISAFAVAAAGVALATVLAIGALLSTPPPNTPALLWNGQVLSLAGPRVTWTQTGRAEVHGRGVIDALGATPAATAWGPKGRVVAAVGTWGEAAAVDLSGPRPKLVLRLPGEAGAPGEEPLCAVATDGRFLARLRVGGTADDRIDVYDLGSGDRIRFKTKPTGASAIALHATPDAERPTVLLGTVSGAITILFPDGREQRVSCHGDEILSMTVDPSHGLAYVVGDDRPLLPASELGPNAALIGEGLQGISRTKRLRLKVLDLNALLAGELKIVRELDASVPLKRSQLTGK
jgi:hypothetical protein